MWFRVINTMLGWVGNQDNPISDDIPECFKTMLRQIHSEPVWNPPAKLIRYEVIQWEEEEDHNGDDYSILVPHLQDYYYFPTRCCDIMSQLYNEDCQLICHPDGGIIGIGDGQCPDWFDRWEPGAVVIWEDERTYH